MINLTREQIENEPAGRTMDALVAEYVMGWAKSIAPDVIWYADDEYKKMLGDVFFFYNNVVRHANKNGYGLFQPSTDIAAFWMVIDKLDRKEWDIQIVSNTEEKGEEWSVSFYHYSETEALEYGSASAKTVPLTGCRARLLAMLEREA